MLAAREADEQISDTLRPLEGGGPWDPRQSIEYSPCCLRAFALAAPSVCRCFSRCPQSWLLLCSNVISDDQI